MRLGGDPNALVQRFRPLYRLHSEEMWYPCHPEDQLRCANLISIADGSIVIPALGGAEGSPADQLLCTAAGLQQLAGRGVNLAPQTIAALQWQPAPQAAGYAYLQRSPSYVLERADDAFLPPYGWIGSANFQPSGATWFDRRAPNNPLGWLGGDPSTFAAGVLHPPSGTPRGAWQEPVTGAWVQTHTVAGVAYVDIIYTAFFAWNGSISLLGSQGEHPNDVETVTVRFARPDLTRPVRYCFQQHGGFAWYDASYVEHEGDRVVVYLARQSHECYPRPGRVQRIYGLADDICDDGGVLWDAPVQYFDRPQGLDADGVDTDALRCALAAGGDPNAIVLLSLNDPGVLWQYAAFLFLGRRPSTVPVSDEDFLYQSFPLATTKWWPSEGPAAVAGPLSLKAAEPSAPGVPDSFFNDVAPYLGPDPLPVCSSSALAPMGGSGNPPRVQPTPVAATASTATPATAGTTVPGSAIGGATAAIAPDADFVDWRGGIGSYLLGSINAHVAQWIAALPDPFVIANPVSGAIAIEQISIAGLHSITVAPPAATSPTTIALFAAAAAPLDVTIAASWPGGSGTIVLQVDTLVVRGVATLVTPVAVSSDPLQWYVPYVGPGPYSYANPPFATTTAINSGSVTSFELTYGVMTASTGNAALDAALNVALALAKASIEGSVSAAAMSAVNALLTSIYDGTARIG